MWPVIACGDKYNVVERLPFTFRAYAQWQEMYLSLIHDPYSVDKGKHPVQITRIFLNGNPEYQLLLDESTIFQELFFHLEIGNFPPKIEKKILLGVGNVTE